MLAEKQSTSIIIDECRDAEDIAAFVALNVEWVETFFVLEPEDKRVFDNAQELILDQGGCILIVRENGERVGAAALIAIEGGDFEFAKMAVSPKMQGRGIGKLLLAASIDKARALGAKKVLICTSSTLKAANHLYRTFGFVDSKDPRHHLYDRADVYLEYSL